MSLPFKILSKWADRLTATLIETIMLAIIQGITEWLPISSSGHLVIAQKFLDLEVPLFFDVLLHFGTLCVVLTAFRNDVAGILKTVAKRDFKSDYGKMALLIVIGSVPTAAIGLIFRDVIESFFHNLFVVGVSLLITGLLLYISKYRGKDENELNWLDAFLIGIAQGVAIVPGISRSGTTIATGLLLKVKREAAFKYSFLLSVPAVLGALTIESKDLPTLNLDWSAMFAGLVTAVVLGYISLKLLSKLLMKGKFHYFAYYCWIAGAIILALQFIQAT